MLLGCSLIVRSCQRVALVHSVLAARAGVTVALVLTDVESDIGAMVSGEGCKRFARL